MYIKHILTVYTSSRCSKRIKTRKWTGKLIQWVAVWILVEVTRVYIIQYYPIIYSVLYTTIEAYCVYINLVDKLFLYVLLEKNHICWNPCISKT